MKKLDRSSIVVGFVLFILAALFSVLLLMQFLCYGFYDSKVESVFFNFGKVLFSVYGYTSILIPVFLVSAGTISIMSDWTIKKGIYLFGSLFPFFTFYAAEKICRIIISNKVNNFRIIQISTILIILVFLIIIEYLIMGILGNKFFYHKKKEIEDNSDFTPEEKFSKEQPEEDFLKEKKLSEEINISEKDNLLMKDIFVSDDSAINQNNSKKVDIEKIPDVKDEENPFENIFDAELEREETEQENIYNKFSLNDETSDNNETSEKKDENIYTIFDLKNEDNNQNTAFEPEQNLDAKQIIQNEEVLNDTVEEIKKEQKNESFERTNDEKIEDIDPLDLDEIQELQTIEDNLDNENLANIKNLSEKMTIFSKMDEDILKEIYNDSTEEDINEEINKDELEDLDLENEESDNFPEQEELNLNLEEKTEKENDKEFNNTEMTVLSSEEENQNDDEESGNHSEEIEEFDGTESLELNSEESEAVDEDEVSEKYSGQDNELGITEVEDLDPEDEEDQEEDDDESEEIPIKENQLPQIPLDQQITNAKLWKGAYEIPSDDLLETYEDDKYWVIDEETKKSGELLKDTLKEFNIEAEVTGIRKGPVVTMFEILPAPGVRLSKIVNLQDNIALRLAASSVRIVAPIPGKRAVGIEVPNRNRSIVSFREIIEQNLSQFKKMAVPVILGKDIQGESQVVDLVKMPHLLIAGATGSGKSVCVNSLILSILYKRSPRDVKLILIDPKIVELKLYNDIPHLLTPVITESKRAFQSLQYCLCEMERRYALLDGMGVRDISSYNKKIVEKNIATEKLPYIIVIIDEFADLMATTGKEMESIVARLAAMSRAIGIHLVLATQRPSIDVITGLIKANIPSRIAFMVASKMDSRIIIDQIGAEKLLGKGDMLYSSTEDPFPIRIQGTFITDEEVERVVEYVKQFGEPDYIDDEIFVDDDENNESNNLFNDGTDPLYEDALNIVIEAGKASASYLQRRLKIGYNRAARIVEDMEARGIIGPANGSKPREIIHIP